MFVSKKRKIKSFLVEKNADGELTVFDMLLNDWESDVMKNTFSTMGIKNISVYIDWLPDYKCINVQGKYNHNYVDLQIEEKEFNIGVAHDEPDDHTYFNLESREQVYETVKLLLNSRVHK